MKKHFILLTVLLTSLLTPLISNIVKTNPSGFSRSTGGSGESVNVYVYMIGSDLESTNSQATSDLMEMLNTVSAAKSDVRLFVYGGGCKAWKNKYFANGANRCYMISGQGIRLIFDDGRKNMAKGDTLNSFLSRVSTMYPAERNMLLFWDHGGGALGGFGVDANFPDASSMSIPNMAHALSGTGLHFDFIGFDACLMSSAEIALSVSAYADYLIATENMAPGIGWDYAKWLKLLCNNPRVSTEKLGREIIDSYLDSVAQKCPEQNVNLVMTDLHCFSEKFPDAMDDFGCELYEMILKGDYSTIARARIESVEFGGSVDNDTIDLLRFCQLMGTEQAKKLERVLRESVVYSRFTSMTGLGGLSVVLPFHDLKYTDKYLSLCKTIKFSEDYEDFIMAFNAVEVCGQMAHSGSMGFYLYLYSERPAEEKVLTAAELKERLQSVLNGEETLDELGLSNNNIGFLRESFENEELLDLACDFVVRNSFRPSLLRWQDSRRSVPTLSGLAEQEELIGKVYQEVRLDLGTTLVDFGWVPLEEQSGNNWASPVEKWYTINKNVCLVYSLASRTIDGVTVISALIPCTFNDVSGYLVASISDSGSYITGFMVGYKKENFGLWGKVLSVTNFKPTDTITLWGTLVGTEGETLFEGEFSEPMRWGAGLKIEKRKLMASLEYQICYRISDIYDRYYIIGKS